MHSPLHRGLTEKAIKGSGGEEPDRAANDQSLQV